jgi:hypothetical protein
MNWSIALNVVETALLAIVVFLWSQLKVATTETVKASVAAQVKESFAQLHWPVELERVLQKTRGVERQELRFKSYGGLWARLRPLASYGAMSASTTTVDGLSTALTEWYFSECGGLFLTAHAREFYFVLQDLLRTVGALRKDLPHRSMIKDNRRSKDILMQFWSGRSLDGERNEAFPVFEYFLRRDFRDWQSVAFSYGENWRRGVETLAAEWHELPIEVQFALLQQVASILRTTLANDLDSRLV